MLGLAPLPAVNGGWRLVAVGGTGAAPTAASSVQMLTHVPCTLWMGFAFCFALFRGETYSIKNISAATAIKSDDIVHTLQALNCIHHVDNRSIIKVPPKLREVDLPCRRGSLENAIFLLCLVCRTNACRSKCLVLLSVPNELPQK